MPMNLSLSSSFLTVLPQSLLVLFLTFAAGLSLQADPPSSLDNYVRTSTHLIERAKTGADLEFFSALPPEVQQNPAVLGALMKARLISLLGNSPKTEVAVRITKILNETLVPSLDVMIATPQVDLNQFNKLADILFLEVVEPSTTELRDANWNSELFQKVSERLRSEKFYRFLANQYLGEAHTGTKTKTLELLSRLNSELQFEPPFFNYLISWNPPKYQPASAAYVPLAVMMENYQRVRFQNDPSEILRRVKLLSPTLFDAHVSVMSQLDLPVETRMDSMAGLEYLNNEYGIPEEAIRSSNFVTKLTEALALAFVPTSADRNLRLIETVRIYLRSFIKNHPELSEKVFSKATQFVVDNPDFSNPREALVATGALLMFVESKKMPEKVARWVLAHEASLRTVVFSAMPKFNLGSQNTIYLRDVRMTAFEPGLEYARILHTAALSSGYHEVLLHSKLQSIVDRVRSEERKALRNGMPGEIRDINQSTTLLSNQLETVLHTFMNEVNRGNHLLTSAGIVEELRTFGIRPVCRLLMN